MNKDSDQAVAPRPAFGRSARGPLRSVRSIPSPASLSQSTNPMPFRVELDIYRGPLDLLLYLVRKQELDVCHIPIAPITQQYLEYLEVLQELDVNAVGDFLEVAGLLIEIKSRLVLPHSEEATEEDALEDPRAQLVQQLLEYKQYKDAASMLEERGATGRCVTLDRRMIYRLGKWIRQTSRSMKWSYGTWSAPWAACCVPMK